ncbi:hypothetical protein Pcinc_011540 [Petrolisthes cinctipes]|uniref:Uncharacterized protein n=1 Tax=Petrolisthes cinctipes TaxID=88211 RepID=A0AAE1KW90_PETCI|nr:hypothetical protein Pcinc_011540 [Petrolisthes cinctipes]
MVFYPFPFLCQLPFVFTTSELPPPAPLPFPSPPLPSHVTSSSIPLRHQHITPFPPIPLPPPPAIHPPPPPLPPPSGPCVRSAQVPLGVDHLGITDNYLHPLRITHHVGTEKEIGGGRGAVEGGKQPWGWEESSGGGRKVVMGMGGK